MLSSAKTDVAAESSADFLAELRATVATIQQQNRENGRPANAVSGRTASDWLDHALGLFETSVDFEEAVRYGQEWREADRPLTSEE